MATVNITGNTKRWQRGRRAIGTAPVENLLVFSVKIKPSKKPEKTKRAYNDNMI